MIKQLLCLTALCAQSPLGFIPSQAATTLPESPGQVISGVRTTAYTHTEDDHIEYGCFSAVGTPLHHSSVRSAAADWSVYPLGTVFQIQGDSSRYVVDDYGSALVGTGTIDIYQPTKASMNNYGTRNVNIRVLRWGSRSKSLSILQPRAGKAAHVRKMISRLQVAAA
jgi:3D (Asp-Asp-Asp) domain-containing protein